ncbi:hypothetical protein HN51_036896, partial [Arachis hypogaea]
VGRVRTLTPNPHTQRRYIPLSPFSSFLLFFLSLSCPFSLCSSLSCATPALGDAIVDDSSTTNRVAQATIVGRSSTSQLQHPFIILPSPIHRLPCL